MPSKVLQNYEIIVREKTTGERFKVWLRAKNHAGVKTLIKRKMPIYTVESIKSE